MSQPHIHDQWAALSYIPDLAGDRTRPDGAPTWLDDFDARRLTAYQVLSAYTDNTRRYWLPASMWARPVRAREMGVTIDASSAEQQREYGDPALVVNTARSLLLGDDQTITCDSQPVLDFLTEWATRERFGQKILEGEEHTITQGDGVHVLHPSGAKGRVRHRVYDPGFYFPDTRTPVDGWDDDDFPPIVHLAWEWIDNDQVTWIRRTTYRMTRLEQPRVTAWGDQAEWTCMYRVVDYPLDHLKGTVYSPEMGNQGNVLTDWTDLLVDFIPVVHVPNDPSTERTWGRSLLLLVGQILDDLQYTDTDLAAASQTASPAFVTSGAPAGGPTGRPGEMIGLPEGASGGWADTSKNLTALTGYITSLIERLAQNTRLSQVLLGAISPDQVPSGYALQLGFAPAQSLVREMRAVRDEKYPLILRFVLRLSQAWGWLDSGPTPEAAVTLGAAFPSDLPGAIAAVKDLLPAHGISTLTAVNMLKAAGLPVDDAKAEVQRIRQESYEQAKDLAEATGNFAAAAEMLGVPPATITLSPAPVAE